MTGHAGDHAIGMFHFQHAGREDITVIIDQALHVPAQIALALQALVEKVGIIRIVLREPGVADLQRIDP